MNTTHILLTISAATLGFTITAHTLTLHRIKRITMSYQDQINAVVAQLHKSHQELSGKLSEAAAALEAQLVDAGVAEQVDLSALTAIAQQLDDLVPDTDDTDDVEHDVEDTEASDDDEDLDEAAEAVDEPVEDTEADADTEADEAVDTDDDETDAR